MYVCTCVRFYYDGILVPMSLNLHIVVVDVPNKFVLLTRDWDLED